MRLLLPLRNLGRLLELLTLDFDRKKVGAPTPRHARLPTVLGLLAFLPLVTGCLLDTDPGSANPPGGVVDSESDGAVSEGRYGVPVEFVESVLADELVTFEEFVLANQQAFRCMVEGGLEGTVAFDPALSLSYPADIRHPLDNQLDNPTDHASPVFSGCQLSIEPIVATYARDHPENAELLERQRQGILACVRGEIPDVYREMSDDWDLDTIRVWLYGLSPEDFDSSDVVAAADCVNSYGTRWVSLREAAGLED